MTLLKLNIFLIDGLGALMTGLAIGLVLPLFETGMPTEVLRSLAAVALIFAIYSLSCFYFQRNNRTLLKVIAVANLIYCLVTASLIVQLYGQLTALALFYFVSEIIVILALAGFELKCAASKNQ